METMIYAVGLLGGTEWRTVEVTSTQDLVAGLREEFGVGAVVADEVETWTLTPSGIVRATWGSGGGEMVVRDADVPAEVRYVLDLDA